MTTDFNHDIIIKLLAEIEGHRKCPCFQGEVIRLVKDLVSSVNDPQTLPDFMLRLKIGRRRFS